MWEALARKGHVQHSLLLHHCSNLNLYENDGFGPQLSYTRYVITLCLVLRSLLLGTRLYRWYLEWMHTCTYAWCAHTHTAFACIDLIYVPKAYIKSNFQLQVQNLMLKLLPQSCYRSYMCKVQGQQRNRRATLKIKLQELGSGMGLGTHVHVDVKVGRGGTLNGISWLVSHY